MEKFDTSEGKWRTVGGRRIFIRDGESLSDAMKKSGKFKNTKKEKEYTMDGKKITESDIKSEYNKELKAGNIDKNMSYEDYKSGVVDDKNSNVRSIKEKESSKNIDQMSIKNNEGKVEKLDMSEVKKIEDAGNRYEIQMKDGTMSVSKDKVVSINGKEKESSNKYKDLYDKEDYDKIISHLSEEEKRELQDTRDSLMYYPKGSEEYKKTYQKGLDLERKAAEKYFEKKSLKDDSDSGLPEKRDVKGDYEWKDKEREAEYNRQLDQMREAQKLQREYEYQGMSSRDAYLKAQEEVKNKKQQSVDKLKNKLNSNKEDDEVATVKSQMSELEQASGSKVKDAFQTDLFGNGKENRFILEDGTIVGHTLESFGQKTDSWYVGDKSFKNYDEVKNYLSGSKGGSDKYTDYYKKENLGEPSNYKKGDQIEFNDGYYSTIKGSIVREATDSEKKYHINSNLKGYIVRDSNGNEHVVADTKIKGRGETDKAYKKAFEEYKKKHPNTKLSYGQFVDISEGK